MNSQDQATDPGLRQAIADLATGSKTPEEAGPAVRKIFADAFARLNVKDLTENQFRNIVIRQYGGAMALATATGHDFLVVADRTMQSLRFGRVQIDPTDPPELLSVPRKSTPPLFALAFADAVTYARDQLTKANIRPKLLTRHDPSYC